MITPNDYAQAFIAVADGKHAVENLLQVIRKNGDWSRRAKIIAAIEAAARAKSGKSLATITSARTLTSAQLHAIEERFPKEQFDYEHSINPELIAGVRVEIDGESKIDASLAFALRNMFTKK